VITGTLIDRVPAESARRDKANTNAAFQAAEAGITTYTVPSNGAIYTDAIVSGPVNGRVTVGAGQNINRRARRRRDRVCCLQQPLGHRVRPDRPPVECGDSRRDSTWRSTGSYHGV